INSRHEFHLNTAKVSLDRAHQNMETKEPPEIVSSDLRSSLYAIAEIVGETSNEDVLDRLFQNFCIGK
ncbi:MAG: tRNA uridine-5-carboxymethylaminomethyl(34) synthesis GTPase MnmE, partial [Verrucomicrobiota bacterium]